MATIVTVAGKNLPPTKHTKLWAYVVEDDDKRGKASRSLVFDRSTLFTLAIAELNISTLERIS